jgi:hypothetical protein
VVRGVAFLPGSGGDRNEIGADKEIAWEIVTLLRAYKKDKKDKKDKKEDEDSLEQEL